MLTWSVPEAWQLVIFCDLEINQGGLLPHQRFFPLFSLLIAADIPLLRKRPVSCGTDKQKYPETRIAQDGWAR